jgi:predicted phosphodiesterase
LSQLEEARLISEYRNQGKTFNDIGLILDRNPEACRSTLRRYESDLNNDLSILNILDNEVSDDFFTSKKTEKVCQEINEREQKKGYGKYLVISDIHEPFGARNVIKKILLDSEVKKIDTCIIDGDLFQMDIASKFPQDRDELIETSLNKGSEILEVLSNQFKQVYIVEGNHDRHAKRELIKSIKNGLKRLIKDVSPIQTVIDELYEKNKINNIQFTYGNELFLGNVVFAHPDYFAGTMGQTVIGMADSYLAKNRNVNAVIIGHTHQIFFAQYKGIYVFENGCVCKEMDYIKGAKKHKTPWVLGYGIYSINKEGNLNIKESKVIPMAN